MEHISGQLRTALAMAHHLRAARRAERLARLLAACDGDEEQAKRILETLARTERAT